MSSLGVFEVYLWIKGKIFTHPVKVIIIRIDCIHSHKLTCDVIARQVKFAGAGKNSITALKQTGLPAMISTMTKEKYKSKIEYNVT
jgi:hypothetical protein